MKLDTVRLFDQFQKRCWEECGLSPGMRVLVGVSGGPDSLSLMDLLVRSGFKVVVAHFNHGLRPEADEDAQRVAELAHEAGLDFVLERQDIGEQARQQHLSLEEAARVGRYQFLFAQARQVGAQALAVGHTADDQVETVLMHLLRGAGMAGLKGMTFRSRLPEWDSDIPLVRPLLSVWRDETVTYCQERGLEPIYDASNLNTTFFRNRLRHELIPYLQGYNPQIKEGIWRTAQSLAGDLEVLESSTQTAWEACKPLSAKNYVSLSLGVFRGLQRGLQRRVLRRATAGLRPDLRDVDFASIERGIEFACTPSRSAEMDFLQGLRLSVTQERLVVAEWGAVILRLGEFPQLLVGQVVELLVAGKVNLWAGWTIQAEFVEGRTLGIEMGDRSDPAHAWLDRDALELPLMVRTRRPGDRFQPLGMDGHSLKLSDFWVNQHLPREAREGWPLVFSGETLAWLPLFRPAHPFRIKDGTKSLVHLWIRRENS